MLKTWDVQSGLKGEAAFRLWSVFHPAYVGAYLLGMVEVSEGFKCHD